MGRIIRIKLRRKEITLVCNKQEKEVKQAKVPSEKIYPSCPLRNNGLLLSIPANRMRPNRIILVLGMTNGYYDSNIYNQYAIDFGQEFRDFIRIASLVDLGFTVFSMDDKHDTILGKHCNANFNDFRRMFIKMIITFPINLKANFIILDYFFSPDGWNSYRWKNSFIALTLIQFAKRGTLAWMGKIILPNMKCIKKYIDKNISNLNKVFTISLIKKEDINNNPLVLATSNIDHKFVDGGKNPFINANQLIRLDSNYPFYELLYNKNDNMVIF